MSTVGTLYDDAIKNGMYVLLATNTASHSTSLDFTGLNGPYSSYMFDIDGVRPNVATNLWMRLSDDNGASFKTINYDYQNDYYYYSGGSEPGSAVYGGIAQGSTWLNNFYLALSLDGNGVSGRVRSCGLGANHRQWLWDCQYYLAATGTTTTVGAGLYGPAITVNAVRFAFDGAFMENGVIRMYGLRTGANVL